MVFIAAYDDAVKLRQLCKFIDAVVVENNGIRLHFVQLCVLPPEFAAVAVNVVLKVLGRVDEVYLEAIEQYVFPHISEPDDGNSFAFDSRVVLPVLPRAVFRDAEDRDGRIFNVLP